MASDQGPIATEAPFTTLAAPHLPSNVPLPALSTAAPILSTAPSVATDTHFAEIARANSLKRPREGSPTSPASALSLQQSPEFLPSKFAKLVDATRHPSAPPLTGQAAIEDEQRRREEEARLHPADAVSENPAQAALSALRAQAAMSRADVAPLATPALVDLAVKPIVSDAPNGAATADMHPQPDTSPQSVTSGQTLGSAGGHVTHSPAPMDVDPRGDRPIQAAQQEASMDHRPGNLSYPGLLATPGGMSAPPRGMSLPTPAGQTPEHEPSSPSSSRRHKCPFCDTVFTRHHNLKSHLLTHSQEKPYVCQDCQQRFRRLHDLKRHAKLHTGEKPHICPKCDRKFARGDALARHSKGAGGCAGRRPSMGSFGADDDYDGAGATDADESAMTGVIYEGSTAGLTEEEQRRLSLPAITSEHVRTGQSGSDGYGTHARTYPPPGTRAGTVGGLFPPVIERISLSSTSTSPSIPNSLGNGHTPSTSISSLPVSAGGNSLYSLGMTESPKPLSPSGLQPSQAGQDPAQAHRQRSPSVATQLQQQQLGRRLSDLPSPQTATTGPAPTATLPLASSQPQQGVVHSRNSSGPSHGHGSVDSSANLFSSEQGLWAYIQTLEERMKQRDDHVKLLEDQIRQQSERIAQLETTRQTSFDARIALLSNEVNLLRTAHASTPAPPAAPLHQDQQIANA